MTHEIRATASPGEVRIAVLDSAGVCDYALWRQGAPDGLEAIHRGRVIAHVPAMAGSFVALAGTQAEGFLPDSEVPGGPPSAGQGLIVRVTRAAQGGKGPRLSARLPALDPDWHSTGRPSLLHPGPGPLLALAAQFPEAAVLVDDAALAATLAPALGSRLSRVPRAFDEALASDVAALAESVVDLPGGARLSIVPTPALVAIDVDAGAASAARGTKSRHQRALNQALLPALARQIRLRNLGGAIVVDPAGMTIAGRRALLVPLAVLLAEDPARPRLIGLSGLGLIEILRPRRAAPLHEMLAGPHAAGLAALRALASAIAAQPATPPVLRAAPAIVAALQADPVALTEMAARAGRPAVLRADPTLAPLGWVLEGGHG